MVGRDDRVVEERRVAHAGCFAACATAWGSQMWTARRTQAPRTPAEPCSTVRPGRVVAPAAPNAASARRLSNTGTLANRIAIGHVPTCTPPLLRHPRHVVAALIGESLVCRWEAAFATSGKAPAQPPAGPPPRRRERATGLPRAHVRHHSQRQRQGVLRKRRWSRHQLRVPNY